MMHVAPVGDGTCGGWTRVTMSSGLTMKSSSKNNVLLYMYFYDEAPIESTFGAPSIFSI